MDMKRNVAENRKGEYAGGKSGDGKSEMYSRLRSQERKAS